MPDDRVTEIRRNLKVARALVMASAREADRHNPTLHQRLMLCADALDDASEANEDVDRHLASMEAAYEDDRRRAVPTPWGSNHR